MKIRRNPTAAAWRPAATAAVLGALVVGGLCAAASAGGVAASVPPAPAAGVVAASVSSAPVAVGVAPAAGADARAAGPAAAPLVTAFVRVNQVGYAASAPKRAYLLTRAAAAGAVFTVSRGATVVAGPTPVGADLGAWSNRFAHVYALDFDGLSDAGTYTVAVGGPVSAVSPPFAIGDGTAVYGRALTNALRFYQTERDGRYIYRSRLRTAAAHLNDRHAMTYRTPRVNGDGVFRGDLSRLGVRLDASGGWWDAGDYLKFVHTTTYVESSHAGRRARLPGADGCRLAVVQLLRRGQVRRRVAVAHVGRPHPDVLLPGRHRQRQRPHGRRPRHLAPAAARRHLARRRPRLPLHPSPAGVPRRPVRREDQPQPRRSRRGGARRGLPGLPRCATRPSPPAACAAQCTSSHSPTPRRRSS